MGVSTNIYAMYGIRINWNEDFYDIYEDIYESTYDKPNEDFKKLDILIDGMGGKYMYFGKILFDSGDFRWGCEDSSGDVEIDFNELNDIKIKYVESFSKVFPDWVHLLDQQFKLLVFTFYS